MNMTSQIRSRIEETAGEYGAKIAHWKDLPDRRSARAIIEKDGRQATVYVQTVRHGDRTGAIRNCEIKTRQALVSIGAISTRHHEPPKDAAQLMGTTAFKREHMLARVMGPPNPVTLGAALRDAVVKTVAPAAAIPAIPATPATPATPEAPETSMRGYQRRIRRGAARADLDQLLDENGGVVRRKAVIERWGWNGKRFNTWLASQPDLEVSLIPGEPRRPYQITRRPAKEVIMPADGSIEISNTGQPVRQREGKHKMFRPTRQEYAKMMKLLMLHGKQTDTDRYAYADGWSDERIAGEIHPDMQATQVKDCRREQFGILESEHRRPLATATMEAMQQEIAALREKVDTMARIIERWEPIIAQLA